MFDLSMAHGDAPLQRTLQGLIDRLGTKGLALVPDLPYNGLAVQ